MKVMLDTNICIYLIKQKPASVLTRFEQYVLGEIGISSITVAELQFGVSNSQKQQQNQEALDLFLAPLEIVDFDVRAAQVYGRIRTHLKQNGTPIGAYDMLIAAHAQSLDVTLVTNNLREFSRIPNLLLENWAE
ncbi:MAG: type II toxin-antitoxin system VapC family toxin [Ardenticatenaceae bacterium]|nr:type II toxin-antitoxin system VapC family toxin [Ardenticatenaceae bacterium]